MTLAKIVLTYIFSFLGEGFSISNPNNEFYYERKTVQVQVTLKQVMITFRADNCNA